MKLRSLAPLAVLSLTLVGIACVPASGGPDGDDGRPSEGEGEGEGGEGEGEGEGGGGNGDVAPGGACTCDDQCESTGNNPGKCVYGVCFQEASSQCSGSGSQAECQDGSRCWPLIDGGPGMCWPDCDANTCVGTCDADGSCAPSSGATCDESCAENCFNDNGGGGGGGEPVEPVDLGSPPPPPTQSCADIPSFVCDVPGASVNDVEAFCGELVAFDPRTGDGYDDYPLNGETANNQYRSFIRRDVMLLVKYAAAHTRCTAQHWDFGNDILGLGDMSEADGSIPGTSDRQPGHPPGSHERGYDMDIAYYQLGAPNNRLREVCPHTVNGQEAYHCTGAPTTLDVWRTTVFIAKLMDSPQYLTAAVDGQIGPIVQQAGAVLCDEGIISGKACGAQGFSARRNSFGAGIAFDPTEAQDIGWFYFHHHHLHLSIIDKLGNILPNW
jgi:hypothetical protein